jgi:hypothetical protein
MERITWIGPLRSRSSAGDVARGFVRALASNGVDVAALDAWGPSDPPLDARESCEDWLEGAVRVADSTVVVQAPLSELARKARFFTTAGCARRVAYIVVDVTALDDATRAAIEASDEVWTPSTLQRELAASLGIPRETLRVVPPGVDSAMSRAPVHATAARARVVVDGDMAFVAALRAIASDFDVVLAPRQASAAERARVFASCDLAVALPGGDPWWRFGLEALASGIALSHAEDGVAAEFVDAACTFLLGEQVVADPKSLALGLTTLLADRPALERAARESRAAIAAEFTFERAAARLVQRESKTWRLPETRLARVLADLGLPTPREIVGAAKSRIVLCAVTEFAGPWCAALAGFLTTHDAHDDVTLVLWVDDTLAPRAAEVAARAEAEIARCARGANGPDVTLVVAPVDHVPFELAAPGGMLA